MRQIKFRVWSTQEKKYVDWTDDLFISCSGKIFENDYEANEDGTPIECMNGFDVEQFTGLHDKNGKEIYEGDIVHNISDVLLWDYSGIVKYDTHKECGYFIYLNTGKWSLQNNSTKCELYVIGNIHENPELLEATK